MHGGAARKLKGIFIILEARINSKKKKSSTKIAIPVAQSWSFIEPHRRCVNLEEDKEEWEGKVEILEPRRDSTHQVLIYSLDEKHTCNQKGVLACRRLDSRWGWGGRTPDPEFLTTGSKSHELGDEINITCSPSPLPTPKKSLVKYLV